MLSTNKMVHAKDTIGYKGYVYQVSKCLLRIRFNTSFCAKYHKKHQAIFCYTLLHQSSRGERKNSLRKRRDISVSDRELQRFFFTKLP